MKRLISVLLISAIMMTAAGCKEERRREEREEESSGYGEEIFVCDPANFMGFEGAYANGDTITLLFDEDELNSQERNLFVPGVAYDFTRGYLLDDNYIEVFTGGTSYNVMGEYIDIDDDEMTMTFDVEDIDAEDIIGVSFHKGDVYTIDFNRGEMSALIWGGDCRIEINQEYDASTDSWGEAESEVIPEPMTIVPEVEPDVEPDVQLGEVGGFITPFMAEYTPDEWEPELDEYLFGMIDLEGNLIYDPMFTSVRYIETAGAYIVGGEVDGVTRYGIMNDDGYDFTGLIYDGAYYDLGVDEYESGHFYMTTYTEGNLHVSTYDDNLILTDDDVDITIDEDELPYEASNLGVCHMALNGALIRDCSQFYPHNVMIDVETGEVLHDFYGSFGDEYIFGDLIIVSGVMNEDITIYDYDGEIVFEDPDATGLRLTDYRYALASDGMLVIFDREANDCADLEIASNAIVDMGCGILGVTDRNGTIFYNELLEQVATSDEIYLDWGYLSGRFSEDWGGNIIFVSFSDDTITNVMNGAVMEVNDSCFYSHERDYIFADDIGDGNLSEHHWYLYDNEFNLLLTGDDYGDVIYDQFTYDMYVSEYSDEVTTIYSIDTCETVLQLDGRYSVSVMDGEFLLTGSSEVLLINADGETLFSYDIA